MLAQSYYEQSPDFVLDQKYTKQSIEEFQTFIDFFPTDPKVPEAEQKIKELNDKLAEKEFNTAQTYEKMEYYDAAVYYYNIVTDTYHDSKYAPLAMLNKIKDQMKSEVTKVNKETLLKEITTFLERYPDDPNISEVKKIQETLSANI
jgi:outer membrane protein assembly factor BamD